MTGRAQRSRKTAKAGQPARAGNKRVAVGRDPGAGKLTEAAAAQVAALQQELGSTKAKLQTVVDKLEAANAGLQTSNADLAAANRKLQASNNNLTVANGDLSARTSALIRANSEIEAARQSLASAKKIAEDSSQAKTNFLARMSSRAAQRRSTAVIGFSDAILNQIFGPLQHDRYLSYVEDIHASSVHLLGLINDVFDIAKIEAGKLRLHEETVDVVALASGAVGFVRPLAAKARVTVVFAFEPPIVGLRVDILRIRQVLLNVLSNAIKFSHRGGKVRVTVGAAGAQGLTIEVADDGVGIGPQALEKIGIEYMTVAHISGRKHEGTGLGLPVSIALMQAHGGALRVASRRGHGTAVTLLFPPERVLPADQVAAGGAARATSHEAGGAAAEVQAAASKS